MIYLKKFNENLDDDKKIAEECGQKLLDMLWELKEIGYHPKIEIELDKHYNEIKMYCDIIEGIRPEYKNTPVSWKEIKIPILRGIEEIEENFIARNVYYKKIHADGRIFNRNSIDIETWRIFKRDIDPDTYVGISSEAGPSDTTPIGKLVYLSIEFDQIKTQNIYTPPIRR